MKKLIEFLKTNDPQLYTLVEFAVSQDPEVAYEFAFATKERFIAGEQAIANNALLSLNYAKYVLRDRFLLGEPTICANFDIAYQYVYDVLKKATPEFDAAIIGSPKTLSYCNWYHDGNAIPDAEEYLLNSNTNPSDLFWYVKRHKKGRWEAAEDVLATDPWVAYCYATKILNDRFLLGEQSITQDPELVYKYASRFGRIAKFEQEMLENNEYNEYWKDRYRKHIYDFVPKWYDRILKINRTVQEN